jgi:hypothetical protein
MIDNDKEEATGSEAEDELAPQRRRSRFAEEDLYCRVGACLEFFKTPRVCMNHRARHFALPWECPGSCQEWTANLGKFARHETLKQHLELLRFSKCRDTAPQLLGLESIPATGYGMRWMAGFIPQRP